MSFLKVKRKSVEDPTEVFILASKKSKLDEIAQVPVFELTKSFVERKDIDSVVDTSIKNRSSIKTRVFDLAKLRAKLRADVAEQARESKLKILNHLRKLDDTSKEESIPVIDLSDDPETDENGNKYVYDLYYSSTRIDLSNPALINDYCLREVSEELYMEDESEDEPIVDDDDDSNDENYWKNEYPDESYGNEDTDAEDHITSRMKKVQLNSDYSLSSDEFDDNERENFDYYNEVVSDEESD